MGTAKLTLLAETLNKLNSLRSEFEKTRNLGGILRIIAILAVAKGESIDSPSIMAILNGCFSKIFKIRAWRLSEGMRHMFQPGGDGLETIAPTRRFSKAYFIFLC